MTNTFTRGRVAALVALVAIGAFVGMAGASADKAPHHDSTPSEHWGVITRNTIGSPVGELRNGPYGSFGVTGSLARPPYGKGSLGIEVAAVPGNTEKVDFGNEVDFFGDPTLALTQVGFHVFQTGENAAPNPENMPNIRFEIDPNTTLDLNNYTTMVWVPDASPTVNRWSGYINATNTGYWYFTGNDVPPCSIAAECTFAQAKAALAADGAPHPVTYTAQVGKGRDEEWVGAVDGLRINNSVFDFEYFGVFERRSCHGHHCGGDDD